MVLASSLTAACGAGTVTVGGPTTAGAPSRDAVPGAAASRPPDPPAPASYRPVVRPGRAGAPGVAAVTGNAGDRRSVRYADGVTVAVERVSQGVEEGSGPGVYPGRPHTALALTLTNDSRTPVRLDQVVVTALYGSPPRIAPPVYEDPAARDFSGTVEPGASATATYVFSVPTDLTGTVVTIVDLDGVHVAARLSGGA